MSFRVGFLGRGKLGLEVLEGLLANPNITVPVIVSCGATPEVEDNAGRMAALAAEIGAEYFHTDRINKPEYRDRLAAHELDLAVAMLWLHTIDDSIINTARLGFVNCHGGHLPEYRGNACANWAILNGEPYIGTCAHLMAPGVLDNGPVILRDGVKIGPDSYIGDLVGELEEKGKALVLASVEAFRTGSAQPEPQDETRASYCFPRIPADGDIDWTRPAEKVHALIRAASRPYPGAYSWFADVRAGGAVRKLTIWRAHVEDHPIPTIYAVPGHLIRLERGAKWGVACGDGRLLILDEIAIDGAAVDPAKRFKTVRQRLGLDVQSQLAAQAQRLEQLAGLGPVSARFDGEFGMQLDAIRSEVEASVSLAEALANARGVAVAANPLRDWSFQKRWYDWEARERWFGVQVYRSLRLLGRADDALAVGYWRFTGDDGSIERRLYATVQAAQAAAHGPALGALLNARGARLVHRNADGDIDGGYLLLDDGVRAGEAVAELAAALAVATE